MVLPPLVGLPVRVEIRPSLGAHAAATSIPGRFILLDASVLTRRGEFERILIHELFHFAWVRLSNAKRRGWEQVIANELQTRSKGELGWSAEWRKNKIRFADRQLRSPSWRRYACESFCDSAAWLYCGLRQHDEFTLSAPRRALRKAWFVSHFGAGVIV